MALDFELPMVPFPAQFVFWVFLLRILTSKLSLFDEFLSLPLSRSLALGSRPPTPEKTTLCA